MAKIPKTGAAQDTIGLAERLSGLLYRGRLVYWSILGAAALFLLGYFVYTEVDKVRRERATLLVEEATVVFDDWKAETETADREALQTRLTERLDLIGRKYPRQYAAQRTLMLRAAMYTELEQWEKAAETYQKLADDFPRGYLAPIALFNAAVSLEDSQDETGARDLYGRVIAEYPASYLVPHALFSRGRLSESIGEIDAAKTDYTTLVDNHPSSGFTRSAKNSILALELKGR